MSFRPFAGSHRGVVLCSVTLAVTMVLARAHADEPSTDDAVTEASEASADGGDTDATGTTHPLDGILRPNLDAASEASAATLAEQSSSCGMTPAGLRKAPRVSSMMTVMLALGLALGLRRRRTI